MRTVKKPSRRGDVLPNFHMPVPKRPKPLSGGERPARGRVEFFIRFPFSRIAARFAQSDRQWPTMQHQPIRKTLFSTLLASALAVSLMACNGGGGGGGDGGGEVPPPPATSLFLLAGQIGGPGYVDGQGVQVRFTAPEGVVVDGVGNVFVTEPTLHVIRKITPDGMVSTLAGLGQTQGAADGQGSGARFSWPWGLALDNAGNLLVADAGNHLIRRVTPAGVVITLAGKPGVAGSSDGVGGQARFDTPFDVAVDSFGNIYVADLGNAALRVITPGGMVATYARGMGTPIVAEGEVVQGAVFSSVAWGPQGLLAGGWGALMRVQP